MFYSNCLGMGTRPLFMFSHFFYLYLCYLPRFFSIKEEPLNKCVKFHLHVSYQTTVIITV